MPGTTVVGGTALHRLVADGTPDLQTIADVDGIYRFVSAAGLEPFGWTPAELCGRQLSYTHPDDRLLAEDALAAPATRRCRSAQRLHLRPPDRQRVATTEQAADV